MGITIRLPQCQPPQYKFIHINQVPEHLVSKFEFKDNHLEEDNTSGSFW